MEPVAALRQIALLLERSGAPSYRVRAFRNAAATAEAIGSEALRERAAAGRLRELPGIGEATSMVITQALAGQTPDYLARLEEEAGQHAGPTGGEPILHAIRGDCHVHSDWSDGGSPIREMAEAAQALGHEYIVLTDHSPRLKVARGLEPARLRQQIEAVRQLNGELAPFRILTGIECDINEDGSLDQEDGLLAEVDVVVGSVHSKLRMPSAEMTPRMVAAIANPHLDILGHCTGRIVVGRGRPESQFDAKLVFAACERFDKAVEINCRPERLDPPMPLLEMALAMGCRFALDTDAHAPGQLSWLPYGASRAAEAGVPPERFVNTLRANELVAWARSHEQPA